MVDFCIYGTNHTNASVDIREKFAFDERSQLEILADLNAFVDEIVLLSTCNRTEVMYRAKDGKSLDKVRETLGIVSKMTDDQMDQFFYFYKGRQALIHLFRVASGLDSMVLGETQILGQTKNAFELSLKHGYSKECFNQIYQRMLNAAKLVRSKTSVCRGSVSVASMAVQLARNIFGTLNDKTVALIGAGEMCELAAEHLVKSGIRDIRVINRSRDKAISLAKRYSGSAHTLDQLNNVIVDIDIVLSSVLSNDPILTYGSIERIVRKRRERSLFIIDIAVPRNVEASVNNLAEVYLYNIDDLQQLVSENLKERQREAAKAVKLLEHKVDELLNFNGRLAGELILSLRERVTKIKNQELERLFQRNETFSAEDKKKVEQTVNLIVNKILHDPIISLKEGLRKESTKTHYITRRFKDFFNL